MKRQKALDIIKLYKEESPGVILSALEIEAGNPDIWDEEYSEPFPWKPKEFKSDLEYKLHTTHLQLLVDLNRKFFK